MQDPLFAVDLSTRPIVNVTPAQSQLYRPARPGREFRATALGQPVPSVATEMRARRQLPLGSSEPEDRQALGRGTVPQAPGYLPGLDGLRAVAVAAVVAYHLGELPGGFLGVDVFFVISGFLITRLLLAEHERTGRIAIGAFWGRRFRRLLPALLVLLVAVALASRAELPGWRLTEIRNDAFGALAYVANWRFVLSGESYFTQGAGPSPLRHTWSLAIEEQFYLLWPLVVAGVLAMARRAARLRVGAVALAVGVGSAVWMAVVSGQGHDLSRIYYGTDTRVFALCGGAWLASWWDPAAAAASRPARRRHRERWAMAGTMAVVPLGMLAVFAVTNHAAFYRGGFQVAAVLSVVVVAGVATGQGAVARGLGSGALVWLGRRSYGIYLWSWPTQVVASERYRLEGVRLDAAVVIVALVAASLSFWLVEEPVRTGSWPAGLGRRPSSVPGLRGLPGFALSGVAVVAVVAVVVGTTVGAPARPTYLAVSDSEVLAAALAPPAVAPARARAPGTTPTTGARVPSPPARTPSIEIAPGTTAAALPPGPFDSTAPLLVDPSATADPAAVRGRPLGVMVAGDSVGWSVGWKLGDRLDDRLRVDGRGLVGCGMLPVTASFVVGGDEPKPYSKICAESERIDALGLEGRPDVVLLWLGAWEVYDQDVAGRRYKVGTDRYAQFLEAQIQRRIDTNRDAGVGTVMPVVPCFGQGPTHLGTERRQPRRVDWVNERIRAVAARNRGWVRLIDPSDLLCDEGGEALTETPDGVALREDGLHLSRDAAGWLWNAWLGGQLAVALSPEPPG